MLVRAILAFAAAVLLAGCATSGIVERRVPAPSKRILLLTHNLFYNHESLAAIEEVLPRWGAENGFSATSLEGYRATARCSRAKPCGANDVDLSMIDAAYLAQFDAIVASTNGELPLTDAGKRALVDFVRGGKGILFLHQAMVTLYTFPEWGEMLGAYAGADTESFDMMNMARRPAVLKVEETGHPAVRGLPRHWTVHDEFPQFARQTWAEAQVPRNIGPTGHPVPVAFSRNKLRVVLSVDTRRTNFKGAPSGWHKGGDYPVAWYRTYGKGRTFYTSLGHRPDLWREDPAFRSHVVGAIRWLLRTDRQNP
jgi:uncharacterized protein